MKINHRLQSNNTEVLLNKSMQSTSEKENNKEVGRSMVETLGVLAIIGVLSVGGIAGYQYAMNKYRSNELLNEASKRALIVVTQLAQGSNEISLEEFTENTYSGGTFSTTVTEWENQFAIEVSGVNQSVCKNLCMDVNGQENVSLAPVDNLETTLTADNCSDINALAFIFDKNLDDEIADDSDEEDDEDDTNKATYSCNYSDMTAQIWKDGEYLANCTCEEGTSGKYASDEEAITAICEGGSINPDNYYCSGDSGSTVMKNGQFFYNGCYCAGKSGSYYTDEEALANMCHSQNYYHCYTYRGLYKNNESYLVTNCPCIRGGSDYFSTDEDAISRLCHSGYQYWCSQGHVLVLENTSTTYRCGCSSGYSDYFASTEEAISNMCNPNYYWCSGGWSLMNNNKTVSGCKCDINVHSYYTSTSEAISNMCLSLNSYYCTNGTQLNKNGTFFTYCPCTNSNGSGYYYTDEEAVSIMCISGASSIYYYCMSGHTLQRTGNNMTSCNCVSGQSGYYYSDSDAISAMCTRDSTSNEYYCSNLDLYNNPANATFVTSCSQYCYDMHGSIFNSKAEAIKYMCPDAGHYTCSGNTLMAYRAQKESYWLNYYSEVISNCNECTYYGSDYSLTDEDAISKLCK